MSIYKSAINKPVTTLLVFVAIIVIGVFSFLRLPIDQFPEMDPPYISVLTVYPGASASEIETNVTKIIENNLNSVDYLKEITSTTKDNISVVLLELEWGTNLDEIINDVRSYIDMVKDELPDGCTNPFIFKFSSSSMPILQYSITADESYPGLDKMLNDEIIPQLSMVNGIGNLTLSGSPERYVYVDIDQQKLDAYGIPLETVGNAIASNNLNLSSGTVKMHKEQYQLEVRSEYIESSEINDIVVTVTPDGRQVFVRDIASVRDTIKDLTLDEKTNGRESVRLMVTKQTGANTVQICSDLKEEMAKIQKNLPNDIKIEVIYDSSEDIVNSINSLEESILYALLFVVLVVLFFLGEWRSTLIISLTIPISLIVAFIYLLLTGSSLNIISLSSLTVAIGMVVDDAIVVLENITKHIERGSSPREASIYATNEVWVSVIATTLVIVVVFVPLTMLTGMAGIMFKELGWLVTIMVCTSTVVAISLTPMLCSKLLKARKVRINERGQIENVPPKRNWYQKYVVGLLDRLDKWYAKALRYCLRHKRWTVLAMFLFFVLSILPFVMGKIGTDFMQQTDNGRISVSVELATGNRIEETMKTARYIESRFYELAPEIRLISTSAGTTDDDGVSAMFSTTMNNTISMTVVCSKKNERERSIFEIAEVLRRELATYPEIIDYQCAVSSGVGGMSSSTVDIEIYGYDFDQTNAFAQDVRAAVRDNVPGARDIDISRDTDRPEIKLNLDKEKLAYHGLSTATVSTYVRNRVNGMAAGYLKEDGDEYDIVVRLQEDDRNSITDIQDMTVPTPAGAMVKLGELGTVEEYWAPPTIERKSRQRIVTVSVTPYETSLGELAENIEKTVDRMGVPSGITVRLAGDYEDQQDTFGDLFMLLALIVLLIYIVLASQFESFVKPVMIMTAVPFALSGVVLALWITGTTLDMIGALGFIMLVGIATKNAIVLVDYTNLMRDRGYELNEAIALSGASRLRPVLMTAITTFLGMLPMALSQGEGSEMWKPMGIVVIGGLLVSTVVTLIVVPVFYAILSRHGERNKDARTRAQFIFMQLSPNPEGDDPQTGEDNNHKSIQ
ncbi:MAG TPA: efflux RND transporter permease subunit [Candidatus Coprenecus stercoripullorum]|nr:efflux RND transporter permease subunit [Candidatus Coprenecus stercoripullorum]